MAGQADGYIIIDTKIDTSGAEAGSRDLESAVRKCAGSIDGLGSKAKSSLDKQVDAFAKLNAQYHEQEKKVDELKKKVAEFGEQKVPTEEYKEIQTQIEAAKEKMDKLIAAQQKYVALGGSENSKKYKSYQYDIDELANTIKYANGELQDLEETGRAFQSALGGENTSTEYSQLTSELQQVSSELDNVRAKKEALKEQGVGTDSEEYTSTISELDTLAQKYDELAAKKREMEQAGAATMNTEPTKEAAAATAQLEQEEEKLANVNERLKESYNGISDSIDRYSQAANSGASSSGKLASSAEKAANSGKKAANSLRDTGSAAGSAKNGIMTLLKYGLGIRSLFVLFNKLRSAIVSGMSSLAQESAPVNASISMLQSSLERLKNSLATAFAPILTAVAPILSKFIDMLSTAATYVSMFFSMLSGKKTYTRALAVQKDYAASLGDTASAAQDVADATDNAADAADAAAEATEKYLSPLDDLNKMDAKNNSGSGGGGGGGKNPSGGGGGGGGGTGSGPLFTEEQIPNGFLDNLQKVLDTLSKIKDLFMSGFWEGLGDYKPRLAELKKDLASIKKSLTEIFTDPQVVAASKKFAEAVVRNLGIITGAAASIGLTLAVNLIGGVESYLSRNKDRVKRFLVDCFNIGTEILDQAGLTAKTAAEVFANTFATQTAQDLTGEIIGIFSSLGALAMELLGRGIRDKMYLVTQPFIDNKDKITEAINNTIAPIESLTRTIEKFCQETSDKLVDFYDSYVKRIVNNVERDISSTISDLLDFYNACIVPLIKRAGKLIENFIDGPLNDFVDGLLEIMKFIANVFSYQWKAAWQNVKNIFSRIMSGLANEMVRPINNIIGLINNAVSGINMLIRGANKIPGVNIPTIGSIPYLASGAVIPPNSEFLAVLGDQKNGNNIEAPENLIRKIVREESGSGGTYRFVAQLDRKVLFDQTISEAKLRQMQTGRNQFEF